MDTFNLKGSIYQNFTKRLTNCFVVLIVAKKITTSDQNQRQQASVVECNIVIVTIIKFVSNSVNI